MRLSSRLNLTQQNALLLAAIFIVFEVLAAIAVFYFLMLPMARRAADDLAGLMMLSVQTWSELPPVTRPALEYELARAHRLALRLELPRNAVPPAWDEPYLRFLQASLYARTGEHLPASREVIGEETWYWVSLPAGEGHLSVGFPQSRIGARPIPAFLASLAAGLLLALFAGWWLARRTYRPLERLQRAAASLGRGQTPERLPETGPREIAALSRRFNEMAQQVEDLLAARTVLLAGVSHDLRTPLARLRLAVEMLVKKPGAELAAQIEADIEAMDRLIGDVLMLARGFGKEPAASVNLRELLAGVVAAIPGAPARVRIEATECSVEAPPGVLRRIVGNLLENALRYSGEGPVTLQVEAGAVGCRIGVLDRGPGIPPAEREAVFRPFYRLEASRSVSTGGSGLGLAIVRQLAGAQGWAIELQDRPGGGLAAWLTISAPVSSTLGVDRRKGSLL